MSAISTSEIAALSATFAALSDPTRRAMLTRLSQGEASVNELAVPFKMSLPAVSKHIKVLEKAGLLTKTRNAQLRPCKINGVQLKQAVDWIDQYKQLWEGRLDRLDAYLVKLQNSENATNIIAIEAINTLAKSKKNLEKKIKPLKTPKSVKKNKLSPKPVKTQEKTDDNDLQQQFGFDF